MDTPANNRMDAGNYMEPGILAWSAAQLNLEITPHQPQIYERHDIYPLGCTKDATTTDPALGPGIVESKNVDYIIWKTEWDKEHAPPHIEIQLQVQMLVTGATWGVIAALVGGNDLKFYRRLPNEELQAQIVEQAMSFILQVDRGDAPDPYGSPLELAGIAWLYPEVEPGKIITVTEQEGFELVEAMKEHAETRLENEKLEKGVKAKLLTMAEDASILNVPGYEIRIGKSKISDTVCKCEKCGTEIVTRKGYTRTTLKTRTVDI